MDMMSKFNYGFCLESSIGIIDIVCHRATYKKKYSLYIEYMRHKSMTPMISKLVKKSMTSILSNIFSTKKEVKKCQFQQKFSY